MSLLEMLISIFILSCVILGVSATQVLAFRKAQTAYYLDVAIQQIDVIWERLQILKNSNIQAAIVNWNNQNRQVLPNGKGWVQGKYPFFRIVLSWGKNVHLECRENKIDTSGCLTFSLMP